MEIVHLFAHRAALTAGAATILVLLCTQIQASTTDAELKETSVVEQSVKKPEEAQLPEGEGHRAAHQATGLHEQREVE